MTFQQGAEREGQAPCYPSDRMLICGICQRYRRGYSMPAELRAIPVIDASIFAKNSQCPMYEARPVVRPFHEPEIETA